MIPRLIKKTVDLSAAQKVDTLNGPLYQLENGGHTIEITILKNGIPADISGSVSARFIRADGETVFFSGTLNGNIASVTLPQNCYVISGRFGLVVFVAGSGVTSAVYALSGTVYRSTTDDVVDPGGDFPSVEDVMGIIDDCETATAAATAASAFVPNTIAPAYSASSTYEAGDYSTNNGYLYLCTTPITVPEAFDSTKWTRVTAAGEIRDLKTETNIGILRAEAVASSKAPAVIDTVSGSVVHFESSVAGLPLANCVSNISLVQSGSGTSALDNVRNFSPWTGAAVNVSSTDNTQDGIEYGIGWETEAGAVYEGSVDVMKGILTATKYGFNVAALPNITKESEGTDYVLAKISWKPEDGNNLPPKVRGSVISNRFASVTPESTPGGMTESSNYAYLSVPKNELTDTTIASIRAWFQTNSTTIVYTLVTPITYDILPVHVLVLQGDNYIRSDTGDITVDYVIDTKAYIDGKTDGIGDLSSLETTEKNTLVGAINELNDFDAELDQKLRYKAPAIITTNTGNVVTITSDGYPLIRLVADIDLVQSGSGTPSPENVRPITAWTGINITVSPSDDPQDGTTYPVSFADTAGIVYSGTIDIVNGVLTVTKYGFNVSSLNSILKEAEHETCVTVKLSWKPEHNNNLPPRVRYTAISNRFSSTVSENAPGGMVESSNYVYLGLPKSELADTTDASIRAWFESNATYVVYTLVTPMVYQLSHQQIDTYSGTNYISADTGDIAVDVIVDTKKYIDDDYNELYDLIGGHGIEIPAYFKSNLDSAIVKYKENAEGIGNEGDSFIFITDTHWVSNQKHSPNLIRYLIDRSNLRNVVCGGDILSSGTIADELASGYAFVEAFSQIPGNIKCVTGNHDYNRNQHGSQPELWLTPNQAYSMFCAKVEMEIHDVSNFCPTGSVEELTYYMDVPATNTRYLFASIAYGYVHETTKNWIVSQLENNPNMNFIIFSHFLWSGTAYSSSVLDLFNAVKNYSNLKAWIYGHLHYDRVDYLSTGIPLVATDTDSSRLNAENNPYTFTIGTITEQAFDAMTVDYSDRSVECVRIGRGKSRRVNGGINTVSVSGTKALTTSIPSPTWSSSAASVATVINGTVTGVSAGSAVIKASGTDKEEFWYVVVA